MSIQFRNIILPAVLMSSAVFSALTLPLVLFEPEPIAAPPSDIVPIDEPSPVAQSFQPILDIFESGNKGLAIRYIGFSIVASVGAGIVTAELLRQTSRRFPGLGDRFSSIPMDDDDDVMVIPEWSRALALDKTEQDVAIPTHIPAALPTPELVTVGAGAVPMGPEFEASPAVSFNGFSMTSLMENISVESASAAIPVLDAAAGYKTCRVNVPHLEKRLFAVLFEGDYYRLARTGKTRESALAIADRLKQQGNTVIITQDDETHSVWVLEPHAFPYLA